MNFKAFFEKLNNSFKPIVPYLKLFKSKFFIIWGCVVAVLCALVITLFTITIDYYVLNFNGQPVGYVRNESVVNGAIEEISLRFSDNEDILSELESFSVGHIKSSNLFLSCSNKTQLMDIIAAGSQSLFKGYSIYVNGELIGSVMTEKVAKAVVENYKLDRVAISPYLATENDSCTVTFKENVEIIHDYLAVEDIITKNEYNTLYDLFEDKVHYTVECVQTLTEDIPYVTYYNRNDALSAGAKEVVSKGVDGSKKVQYKVVVDDGELISKSAIKETILKQPQNARIQIGSGVTGGLGTNLGLIFPVEGYITSEFGGRPDPFTNEHATHRGLDLGAVTGTPIYAASGGKVIQASNKYNGYGNCVIIEHSKGFKTLYAHCSELLVSEGDYVVAGQLIAKVGSTGRSTGPHLHYGMMVNGEYVDPLLYY